jgi:hypothetical protein
MRFMMLMIPRGYETAKPGTMPDPKAVAAMMKYNESLQKAGVLVGLDGLHPRSAGARVSFSGGQPKVMDGPFAETKEVVGGYWMIQVKSKEEAIEWASRCPAPTMRSSKFGRYKSSPTSLLRSRKRLLSLENCRRSPRSASRREGTLPGNGNLKNKAGLSTGLISDELPDESRNPAAGQTASAANQPLK